MGGLERMDVKWSGGGALGIGISDGNVGRRWVFDGNGYGRRPTTSFRTRFTIVAGACFIVADHAFYCRKALKNCRHYPF